MRELKFPLVKGRWTFIRFVGTASLGSIGGLLFILSTQAAPCRCVQKENTAVAFWAIDN
jgi:hypothetical protein